MKFNYIIIKAIMTEERYLSFGEQKRFKYILVGDSNVGKTALFWRFIEGDFSNEKNTQVTTVDFKIKNIMMKGKPIKLYIWDTAGQERYRSIVSTYFKGCQGVLLCFDISNAKSFENATEQWYEICKSKAGESVLMLVGTKSDLKQEVEESKIREWAIGRKIKYMATSARNGTNVEEVFLEMTRMIISKQQAPNRAQSFALGNDIYKKKKKQGCC